MPRRIHLCIHAARNKIKEWHVSHVLILLSLWKQGRLVRYIMHIFPNILNFQRQHVCFVGIDCSAAVLGAVRSKFSHPCKNVFYIHCLQVICLYLGEAYCPSFSPLYCLASAGNYIFMKTSVLLIAFFPFLRGLNHEPNCWFTLNAILEGQ